MNEVEALVKFTKTSLFMYPMNVETLHIWFAFAFICIPDPKLPKEPRFASMMNAYPIIYTD